MWPAALSAAVAIALIALAWRDSGQLAALAAVGLALGLTLYHASFGFASGLRRLFVERDVAPARAHLIAIGAATLAFTPMLAAGSFAGQPLGGAWAPVGWSVAIGAFMFGIGMQLGGGCGSGTLYALGGGSMRMLVTLVAFCAGGFWATLHADFWEQLPSAGEIVLGARIGWWPAAALQLAALALLGWWLSRGRRVLARPPTSLTWRGLAAGPWPLVAGGLALAALNLATLLIAGHPWTITWGFTLWGAKAAALVGWDPASSAYWSGGFQRAALEGSVLEDVTSLMDLGILVGAAVAAAAAGRLVTALGARPRYLAAAIVGGLAMGYGARLAFGCNIGAYFSGIASSSLHGWLWIAAALPGTWVGVRLRPLFGFRDVPA